MTKVFISMPMRGKSDDEIKELMKKTIKRIEREVAGNVQILDSVFDGADMDISIVGDAVGAWYLGKSIQLLASADIVYFVNDYESARGCVIENTVAKEYGIECREITV